jgi:hypothetical protein
LTQTVHAKLGSSINGDIMVRTNCDSTTIDMFFPEFQIANRTLSLKFVKNNTKYLFLGATFEEKWLRYDLIERNVSVTLPRDFAAVVKTEFQLNPEDVARLQHWCRQILTETSPALLDRTNNFFVAPFSPKFDSFQASLYWLEGKKLFRAELDTTPDRHQRMEWKVLANFNEMPASPNVADLVGFIEWRDLILCEHVFNGMLLTVEPTRISSAH